MNVILNDLLPGAVLAGIPVAAWWLRRSPRTIIAWSDKHLGPRPDGKGPA